MLNIPVGVLVELNGVAFEVVGVTRHSTPYAVTTCLNLNDPSDHFASNDGMVTFYEKRNQG